MGMHGRPPVGCDDQNLFVEFGERRFGPFRPSGGPVIALACRRDR
jgi:hypothetical protein